MPIRTVELTEEQGRLAEHLIRSGRFRDANELVDFGLGLVADSVAANAPERLKAAVEDGIRSMAAGPVIELADDEAIKGYFRDWTTRTG